MGPLNNILNRINTWSNPETNAFKKVIGTRVTNLLVSTPLEIAAIAQNILLTPVYAASTVFKGFTKVVALVTGSQAIKNFEAKLPGFTKLLNAIAGIVAYTIGAAFTATLGVLSPRANFAVHCGLGLVSNKKQNAAIAELEAIEFQKFQEELNAIQDAENFAQEIERNQEQEELNELEDTYNEINTIENEIEETVTNNVSPLIEEVTSTIIQQENQKIEEATTIIQQGNQKIEEGTTKTAKTSTEEFSESMEGVEDKELDFERDFEFVGEYEEYDSHLSKAFSALADNAKIVKNGTYYAANKTYNAVKHLPQSTKNAYNYVTSFLGGQKQKV